MRAVVAQFLDRFEDVGQRRMQLALDEPLVNYLIRRIERSFAAAHDAVQRLDHESMRQHRPVTRALAAELFRTP